ncbi:MAG: glycosyl transferase, partial [Bacteriovorax sp.]
MKEKILFLTPQLPYPPVSGGVVKSNKMVDYLSRNYDLSLVFLLKNEDATNVEHYLSSLPIKDTFYIDLNVPRSALTFVKSLLFNVPMSVLRNRSQTLKKEVERMSVECDVIIIDHFLMFQYVPDHFKGRIVLHQHNAEFVLWSRYSETHANFAKRMLIQFEASRIKKYEKYMMERAHRILAAPNDIEILSLLVEDKKNKFVETYHLGDEDLLAEKDLIFESTQKSLLYIGTLSWEANRDGLYWFLESVWPRLKAEEPDLIFNIIGKLQEKAPFSAW